MLETSIPVTDLGRLKYGKPFNFVIPVKNSSLRDITIDKVMVGCGSCTKVQAPKTLVQPNEEISINATFTPGSTGKQKKHISVRYDGDQILKLEFTADVYA